MSLFKKKGHRINCSKLSQPLLVFMKVALWSRVNADDDVGGDDSVFWAHYRGSNSSGSYDALSISTNKTHWFPGWPRIQEDCQFFFVLGWRVWETIMKRNNLLDRSINRRRYDICSAHDKYFYFEFFLITSAHLFLFFSSSLICFFNTIFFTSTVLI